jgi:alpha-tubulin suppressor-like RCC1 family protein
MKEHLLIRSFLQILFAVLLLNAVPGVNAYGKLANTISNRDGANRNDYQRISCGYNSTFEIRGGTLWAWGSNFNGQLGDGTYNDHENPVQIGVDDTWRNIAAGTSHTLGLKADGSLWAWGDNTYGQLGNGTNTSSLVPIQIPGTWSSVSANNTFSLALKADGSLWAWGYNAYGQLGDGSNTNKNSPVQIAGTWSAVVCGGFHTLALKADGSLWAWGYNSDGQLGNGTNTSANSPMQVAGNWTSIVAGAYHSLALQADGSLWTWGQNTYGQLGIGNNTNSNIPVPVAGTWSGIAAGSNYSFALKANGGLWSFGYNAHGELGDGTNTNKSIPVQIAGNWLVANAGAGQSIGQKSDGTLWAWGRNDYGQFGNGNWNNSNVPTQTSIQLQEWIKVIGGANHTLAIKSDGTLWAWGSNWHGELGDGTGIDSYTPVLVAGSWLDVSAGEYHSLGIKTDGTLWAWGYNNNGQLGDGTNNSTNVPVQIGTDHDWVRVSAGGGHSMALKADGSLWSWGRNYDGQVGDSSNTDRNSPVQLTGLWRTIVAGTYHSLGLRDDGTLWAWGQNYYHGQLGNGSNTNYNYPVQSGVDNSWVDITSGYAHSMGLKANGTIWAWGYNGYGQLGDNTYMDKNSPIQVGVDNNWTAVSGGDIHCMALKANGDLWAWGYNGYGNLGDGTGTDRLIPVQIASEVNVIQLYQSTNAYHSAIIKPTRDKICLTGYNGYGELGDGSTINRVLYNCITSCVPVAPLISISASPNDTICSGTLVTFTTSVQNEGPSPSYQWYKNGGLVGTNMNSYSSSLLNDSDVVYCVLTSNANCLAQPSATSNADTIKWHTPNNALAGSAGNTETNTTLMDGDATISYTDCDLMATIHPIAPAPVADTTVVKVTIDNAVNSYNGQPYVQRHYDIEPALNAGNATATITLYAYQSEFDAYNTAAATAGLPLLPSTPVDNGNVRITQFHGIGTAPGNYPGQEILISPVVNWDAVNNWWSMTFDVTGFSGFYIHTTVANGPLAIQVNGIAASNHGPKNRIDWTTSTEAPGEIFTIERGVDGRNFTPIADISSSSSPGNHTYWDETPYTGINYYRIKLTDIAKKVSYTKIVSAIVKGDNSNNIVAYPNPAKNTVSIYAQYNQTAHAYLTLSDITGKELMKLEVKDSRTDIDLHNLPEGIYLLKYVDETRREVVKIEKIK